jgi:formylglycine-generating enzyme required for sulfatase activity
MEDKEDDLVEITRTDYRVLRGGSFYDLASDVRSAKRYRNLLTGRDGSVGFRPARTLNP